MLLHWRGIIKDVFVCGDLFKFWNFSLMEENEAASVTLCLDFVFHELSLCHCVFSFLR